MNCVSLQNSKLEYTLGTRGSFSYFRGRLLSLIKNFALFNKDCFLSFKYFSWFHFFSLEKIAEEGKYICFTLFSTWKTIKLPFIVLLNSILPLARNHLHILLI